MVVIPGSELLAATLNVVSQSLQIPVIIFLLIFAIFAVLLLEVLFPIIKLVLD